MARSYGVLCAITIPLGLIAAAAIISHAGPLDPPAGPVSPSYKTLSDVQPRIAINAANTPGDATCNFKITVPGSYYLTGNLVGQSGKIGIKVLASEVSIDLAGFELFGASLGTNAIDSAFAHTSVRNGTIRSWGSAGLNLTNAASIVENISAFSNNGVGLAVGQSAIIRNCTSDANGSHGIQTGIVSLVESCTLTANDGNGIEASQTVVSRCAANNNAIGFNVGSNSHISGCILTLNRGDGIRIAGTGIVINNQCSGSGSGANDGANIHATGSDNRIEANNIIGADRGLDVDAPGNIIIRNTASGNSFNYDVVAGNSGQYISAAAANAINGASGGTAIGSTDPWVNFSY